MTKNNSKHNRNLRQIVYAVLTLLMMLGIFLFSAQNADVSTEQSNHVSFLFGRYFIPGFQSWSESQKLAFADAVEFPVRKLAHMTEYAVLGILAANAVGLGNDKAKELHAKYLLNPYTIAWVVAFFYAISDEVHQYFVPGRACKLSDVGFDSLGAAIGLLLLALIKWRRTKIPTK